MPGVRPAGACGTIAFLARAHRGSCIMSIISRIHEPRTRWIVRGVVTLLAIYAVVIIALMWWWSYEPAQFDVAALTQQRAAAHQQQVVTGSTVTSTLMGCAETLLDKRGGYISNDRFPPGLFMDNVPNWEFGVLTATRDLALALRNDFSRSQSQSTEDPDLDKAQTLFNYDNNRWIWSSTESQYRDAIEHLDGYLGRLADSTHTNAQFYARADNLSDYLQQVSKRLGSLSQRLSASVGQVRLDTNLAGEPAATKSTPTPSQEMVKTPWTKIDDIFYESRGYTWALLEQLKAVEIDFAPILERKNALVSLRQVVRELEESQRRVMSPIILNGSPFGFFANHSLVMANYVSRANAAIIDLKSLLDRG
jgi:hypothetical protein